MDASLLICDKQLCSVFECIIEDTTPVNSLPLTLHTKWSCVERNFRTYRVTGYVKLGLVLKMKTLALQQTGKNIIMKADFLSY